jgi:hypothetical protein
LVASNAANANTCQESISILGAHPTGGTSLAAGVSAANDAKIRTANQTYVVAKQTACQTQQATIGAAKDTLRNTGDYPTGPA